MLGEAKEDEEEGEKNVGKGTHSEHDGQASKLLG